MNIPDQGTGFRPPYSTQFPWDDQVVKLTAVSDMAHTTEADGTVVEAFFAVELPNGDGAHGFGATLVDAERAAWARFKLVSGCPGHEFDPRGRTDGQGWCRHCGEFKHDALTAADLGFFCHECGTPSFESDWRGPVCPEHHPGKKYLDRMHELQALADEETRKGNVVASENLISDILMMFVYYGAAARGESVPGMG